MTSTVERSGPTAGRTRTGGAFCRDTDAAAMAGAPVPAADGAASGDHSAVMVQTGEEQERDAEAMEVTNGSTECDTGNGVATAPQSTGGSADPIAEGGCAAVAPSSASGSASSAESGPSGGSSGAPNTTAAVKPVAPPRPLEKGLTIGRRR